MIKQIQKDVNGWTNVEKIESDRIQLRFLKTC